MPTFPMTEQGGPDLAPELAAEVQRLSPTSGALVELYEVDASAIGGLSYFFHNGLNGLRQPIVWQGQEYTPMPLQASGFDTMGDAAPGRPRLTLSLVDQSVGILARNLGNLEGAKVLRHRTYERYLDAVNFAGGNPNANPSIEFPLDVYWVDRKASENKHMIEFELVAPIDLEGVRLPRRQVIANICPWVYKGAECGYISGGGGSGFPDFDSTKCDKGLGTPNGCKAHFGANAELPYGGFPTCGRVRS